MNLAKRYGMFGMGIVVSALGISLITKAELGTSPITSLAYVLTYLFPFSLGTFTMAVNTVLFFLQAVLQGRDFQKIQFLQLPAALLFSLCIDGWMMFFSFWSPDCYPSQLLALFAGCIFLGLGIALEVIPNVLILPGEGVVRTIAGLTGRRFGRVKVEFDLFIVISAMIVSLTARGQILGIREGTLVAALIVGHISHFFLERVSSLAGRLIPPYYKNSEICQAGGN